MSGFEVARRACELAPGTAVMLCTGQGDKELLRKALDAGARGFLLKDAPLAEVAATLRRVASGDTHVDPELAGSIATPERSPSCRRSRPASARCSSSSPRA